MRTWLRGPQPGSSARRRRASRPKLNRDGGDRAQLQPISPSPPGVSSATSTREGSTAAQRAASVVQVRHGARRRAFLLLNRGSTAGAHQPSSCHNRVAMDHERAMAEPGGRHDLVGHALTAEEIGPHVARRAQAGIGAGAAGGSRRPSKASSAGAGAPGFMVRPRPAGPLAAQPVAPRPASLSVPSIQSACTMRAVARRTLVAMVAPAVSDGPGGGSR